MKIFEVSTCKGREWEKRWRHSDDNHVFMFAYLEGARPKDADEYAPLFEGDSQGAMNYLIRNRSNWEQSTKGQLPPAQGAKKGLIRRFLGLFGWGRED